MIEKRPNLFETIGTLVQFYPKLSAMVAVSSMAALGRMMVSNQPARLAAAKPVESPQVMTSTKRRQGSAKRRAARKASKRVGLTKRTSRKAA
jgi:hypothetical protein